MTRHAETHNANSMALSLLLLPNFNKVTEKCAFIVKDHPSLHRHTHTQAYFHCITHMHTPHVLFLRQALWETAVVQQQIN